MQQGYVMKFDTVEEFNDFIKITSDGFITIDRHINTKQHSSQDKLLPFEKTHVGQRIQT